MLCLYIAYSILMSAIPIHRNNFFALQKNYAMLHANVDALCDDNYTFLSICKKTLDGGGSAPNPLGED